MGRSQHERQQAEDERRAVDRLLEDLGWSGARHRAGNDPPDRIITLTDGLRLGCEVTRWTRPTHAQVEGLDATLCRLAYQQFEPPAGYIVTLSIVPEMGYQAKVPEAPDVRRLASALVSFMADVQLGDEPGIVTIVEVPPESPLSGYYTKVIVNHYDDTWARQAIDDANREMDSNARVIFEEYIQDQWCVEPSRPVFANAPSPKTPEADLLREQITQKAKRIPEWPGNYDEKWLVVVANNPDNLKMWNFRWLTEEAVPDLVEIVQGTDFDAVAFVPVMAIDRFRTIVVRDDSL